MNEFLRSMESPLELVEGFVSSIEVAVPWAALLTDHCTVCVSGLQLTLQPRQGSGESRVRPQGRQLLGMGPGELGPFYPDSLVLFHRTRGCGLSELGLMHDHKLAAGSRVPSGRVARTLRTTTAPGGAGNVCTDH